jgi:hypothetical protein
MEGTSALTEQINDTRHLDNHPGTMNFKQRLHEAQRIHERNMLLASRLDAVQPYYKVADLFTTHYGGKTLSSQKKQNAKPKFMPELEYSLQMTDCLPLTEVDNEDDKIGRMGYYEDFKFTDHYKEKMRTKNKVGKDTTLPRPRNLLLEYSKIQDNRILDAAVVKEPFQDRYIIFGMDVENGQRYELKLNSEDVSNILEGDILVTSVDSVEVWMALLNKVQLQPVETFQQFDEDERELSTSRAEQAVATQSVSASSLIPSAPHPTTRPSVANGFRRRNAQRSASAEKSGVLHAFAAALDGVAPTEQEGIEQAPTTKTIEDIKQKKPKKMGLFIEVDEEVEKAKKGFAEARLSPKAPTNANRKKVQ